VRAVATVTATQFATCPLNRARPQRGLPDDEPVVQPRARALVDDERERHEDHPRGRDVADGSPRGVVVARGEPIEGVHVGGIAHGAHAGGLLSDRKRKLDARALPMSRTGASKSIDNVRCIFSLPSCCSGKITIARIRKYFK